MEAHLIDCGTMMPRGAGVFVPHLARVPCNCLLLDPGGGERLVLVDTGLGTSDMEDPRRLGAAANLLLNARPDPEQPAIRQVARLGYDPANVTDIICTHLDRDHAGGLSDFPRVRVHVLRTERDAALKPRGPREKDRYRSCHFAHGPQWVTYEEITDAPWFGFDCIRELPGLPPGIILVPLPGHTRGHCGVAVQLDDGWLFHCGDAYYIRLELEQRTPAGVRCFRRIAHLDYATAMAQLARLQELASAHAGEIATLASHDPSAQLQVQKSAKKGQNAERTVKDSDRGVSGGDPPHGFHLEGGGPKGDTVPLRGVCDV